MPAYQVWADECDEDNAETIEASDIEEAAEMFAEELFELDGFIESSSVRVMVRDDDVVMKVDVVIELRSTFTARVLT